MQKFRKAWNLRCSICAPVSNIGTWPRRDLCTSVHKTIFRQGHIADPIAAAKSLQRVIRKVELCDSFDAGDDDTDIPADGGACLVDDDLRRLFGWHSDPKDRLLSANFVLAKLLLDQCQPPDTQMQGLKLLRDTANGGYIPAQHRLGTSMEEAGDLEGATTWYRSAVSQGDMASQLSLGKVLFRMIDEGVSMADSQKQKQKRGGALKEAARFVAMAAAQESGPAELLLGECYQTGRGVKRNLAKAVRCFEDAVKHGTVVEPANHGRCLSRLALQLMAQGRVLAPHRRKQVDELIDRASSLSDPDALYMDASRVFCKSTSYHIAGSDHHKKSAQISIPKVDPELVQLGIEKLRRAADCGSAQALHDLGQLHFVGHPQAGCHGDGTTGGSDFHLRWTEPSWGIGTGWLTASTLVPAIIGRNLQRAESLFRRALMIDSNNVDARCSLAELHAVTGRHRKAVTLAIHAVHCVPPRKWTPSSVLCQETTQHNPRALYLLSALCAQPGVVDEAGERAIKSILAMLSSPSTALPAPRSLTQGSTCGALLGHAAQLGNSNAQFAAACSSTDPEIRTRLLEASARQGSPAGLFGLAMAILNPSNEPPADFAHGFMATLEPAMESRALELLHAAEQKGHMDATFQIGESHRFNGRLSAAMESYATAAAVGHGKALMASGKCWLDGAKGMDGSTGVDQNLRLAVNNLTAASKGGVALATKLLPAAQYSFAASNFAAVSYNCISGVLPLLEEAAAAGHAEAVRWIGDLTRDGYRDPDIEGDTHVQSATRWWGKAAADGDRLAAYSAGRALVTEHPEHGVELLAKSATAGDPLAHFEVSVSDAFLEGRSTASVKLRDVINNNCVDDQGRNALLCAASRDEDWDADRFLLLREHHGIGAPADAARVHAMTDDDGASAIDLAASRGSTHVLELLVEHKANVVMKHQVEVGDYRAASATSSDCFGLNTADKDGRLPIERAIFNGKWDTARWLLRRGVLADLGLAHPERAKAIRDQLFMCSQLVLFSEAVLQDVHQAVSSIGSSTDADTLHDALEQLAAIWADLRSPCVLKFDCVGYNHGQFNLLNEASHRYGGDLACSGKASQSHRETNTSFETSAAIVPAHGTRGITSRVPPREGGWWSVTLAEPTTICAIEVQADIKGAHHKGPSSLKVSLLDASETVVSTGVYLAPKLNGTQCGHPHDSFRAMLNVPVPCIKTVRLESVNGSSANLRSVKVFGSELCTSSGQQAGASPDVHTASVALQQTVRSRIEAALESSASVASQVVGVMSTYCNDGLPLNVPEFFWCPSSKTPATTVSDLQQVTSAVLEIQGSAAVASLPLEEGMLLLYHLIRTALSRLKATPESAPLNSLTVTILTNATEAFSEMSHAHPEMFASAFGAVSGLAIRTGLPVLFFSAATPGNALSVDAEEEVHFAYGLGTDFTIEPPLCNAVSTMAIGGTNELWQKFGSLAVSLRVPCGWHLNFDGARNAMKATIIDLTDEAATLAATFYLVHSTKTGTSFLIPIVNPCGGHIIKTPQTSMSQVPFRQADLEDPTVAAFAAQCQRSKDPSSNPAQPSAGLIVQPRKSAYVASLSLAEAMATVLKKELRRVTNGRNETPGKKRLEEQHSTAVQALLACLKLAQKVHPVSPSMVVRSTLESCFDDQVLAETRAIVDAFLNGIDGHAQLQAVATCAICLDRWSNPAEAVRFERTEAMNKKGCGHTYCQNCLCQWIVEGLDQKKRAFKCPHDGCNRLMFPMDVRETCGPAIYKRYESILHEDHRARLLEIGKDPALLASMESTYRACPECFVLINKDGGCDQISCPCGENFDFGSVRGQLRPVIRQLNLGVA